MPSLRKTKTALCLPWCRCTAERFCRQRRLTVNSELLDLYIRFFLSEVVAHGLLHLDWKESGDYIFTEVFEEDIQHIFDPHTPTNWQVTLWMCEYIFSIYGKLQGSPVKRFVEHWYRHCLGTGRLKKSCNEHTKRTGNDDELGNTDTSVCRAGSDD